MLTRTSNISQKYNNNAIHEILLKILEKWSTESPPVDTNSGDSQKIITRLDNEEAVFENDGIMTETVLLLPEDFQIEHPSHKIPDKKNSDTGYELPKGAHDALNTENIKDTGEYVPETVIINSNIPGTEEASDSGFHQEEVPETIIYSPQETTNSNIPSNRSASVKDDNDQKKQGSLKTVEDSTPDEKTGNEADKNYEVPETIIFRGSKDDDE